MNPKVSVIMPIYNVEPYLEECLDSIVNQTLKEIEIICVDDGSTDKSLEILKRYANKDKRIKVLSQRNKGAGAARNYGLSISSGQYLSFLDSDDVCDIHLLERAFFRAEEKNADIVIYKAAQFKSGDISKCVVCKWAYRDENFKNDIFTYKDNSEKIFNSFQNWAWNKLFSSEFIKSNHISFQEIKRTNDLLFTCKALVCAKKITLLDEILYYYRVGMSGNCQATNHVAPLDFYNAFLALKEFLIEKNIYAELETSFVNHALSGCLYNLRSLKDNDAIAYLFTVLKFEGIYKLGIVDFNHKYPDKLENKKEYSYVFSKNAYEYLKTRNGISYNPYLSEKVCKYYRENGLKETLKIILSKLLGRV